MNFSNANFSSLLYLSVILVVLLFVLALSTKKHLNNNLQNLAIWFLIFFGAVSCYYIWIDDHFNIHRWKDEPQAFSNGALLIAKESDGHFYLTLHLNEKPFKFLVDTGATRTLLSKEDFAHLGQNIKTLPQIRRLETANGIIFADEIKVANVAAYGYQLGPSELLVVSEDFEGPRKSLLGLDLLNKFKNFELSKQYLKIQLE